MIPYPIPYEHCENELLIALSLGALINSSSSDLWISACQTVLHGQPALECTGSWLKYRLYFRPKVSKNWAGGDWVFVSVTQASRGSHMHLILRTAVLNDCFLHFRFLPSASPARQRQSQVPFLPWFCVWCFDPLLILLKAQWPLCCFLSDS